MKKLLLLTVASALSATAMAEGEAQPTVISNFNVHSMSANAQYVVSNGYIGMQIHDLVSGQTYDYTELSDLGMYTAGIGQGASSNGIIIGYENDEVPSYWKDGEWTALSIPDYAKSSNLVNSITPDGSRICGSIGVAELSYYDDVLNQAPCVWNWDADKGDFGDAVMLPYPEKDYVGRTPQMVTAVDISADGKSVIGQVVTATGTVRYPIIYKEDAEGKWSYVIPDYDKLYIEGATIPEMPADMDMPFPTQEAFMTPEEVQAYVDAFNAWIDNGLEGPEPTYSEFMTAEEIADYEKALAEYNKAAEEWQEKFDAYNDYFYGLAAQIPSYEFNSIRISPDGKMFANTVEGEKDPMSWSPFGKTYIYVFDIESGDVTKYEQYDDFVLTQMLNGGAALGTIMMGQAPQSFVLYKGNAIDMYTWISSRNADFGNYMKENLTYEYADWVFNEETEDYEEVYTEVILSGRAYATPDLTVIALGVEDLNWEDEGTSYIFNMGEGNAVSTVRPADGEKSIYDLSGRKLKEATAPGIYIINGEKKVVR